MAEFDQNIDALSRQAILFGAGDEGRRGLELLGKESVFCFVDNDPHKYGRTICGKQIVSFEKLLEIYQHYDVVVTTSFLYKNEIVKQLEEYAIPFTPLDALIQESFIPNKELMDLKGIYHGMRCFLIGNGPSLTMADLDLLDKHHCISFASNKIFKAFSQTDWRPELYCATDAKLLFHYDKIIANLPCKHIFLADFRGKHHYEQLHPGVVESGRLHLIRRKFVPFAENSLPPFSEDPASYVIEGFTVTYAMLQWAAFLGFQEIVLLGQDCTYSDADGMDANENDYFCKAYFEPGEFASRTDVAVGLAMQSFCRAAQFMERKGIAVYNATKNSALKYFNRIDLNSML